MKKSTFRRSIVLLLFALLLIPTVNAQVCPGDVTLGSQSDVNAFSCSEITGKLTISGADITDLSPLSSLTSVGGSLTISDNTALTNLDGLSSLLTIAGNLSILFQPSLSNLDGLGSLTTVGGLISITTNSSLTNLDGLSLLTSVGGDFYIVNNDALTEYCGLFPLLNGGGLTGTFITQSMPVNPSEADIIAGGPCPGVCPGNVTLTTQAEVDAFDCTLITGNLTIGGTDINNLSSLSSLSSVGSSLYIHHTSALTNVDGLSSLSSVGGDLIFESNSAISNLDGLSSLS